MNTRTNTLLKFAFFLTLTFCIASSKAALVGYWALDDGTGGAAVTGADDAIDGGTFFQDATVEGSGGTWVNDATRGDVFSTTEDDRLVLGTQGIDLNVGFGWSLWTKINDSSGTIIGSRNGVWNKVQPSSVERWTGISGYNLNDDTWHHLYYGGDLSGVSVYVDGVLINTDTTFFNNLTTVNDKFELGGTSKYSEDITGLLSDVGVWDEALTSGDIKALYELDGGLGYDVGMVAPLLAAHKGQYGTTVGGLTWAYTTGLGATEGLSGSGPYTLVLDGTAGTGLQTITLPGGYIWEGNDLDWNTTANWTKDGTPDQDWSNLGAVTISDGSATTINLPAGLDVSVASLTFQNANHEISSTGGTLAVGLAGFIDTDGVNAEISAPLTGGAPIEKKGTGALTLSSATYSHTGSWDITAGSLIFDSSSDQTIAGNVSSSTGTTLQQASANKLALTGDSNNLAGSVVITDTSGRLEIASSGNTSISGNISGGGSLILSGSGTTSLSGTNTYSGTTTVSAGTLAPTSEASLSGYATSGKVIFDGGKILVDSSGWSGSEIQDLLSNATKNSGSLTINTSSNLSVGAFNAGALSITKTGGSDLELTGTNTFSGGFNFNGGRLIVAGGTYEGIGSGTLTINGGTIRAKSNGQTATINNNQVWNSSFNLSRGVTGTATWNFEGDIVLNNNIGVGFSDSTVYANFNGDISGPGGNELVFSGNNRGIFTLAGDNTYAGQTRLNGGTTLNINSSTAIGTGTLLIAGTSTLGNTSGGPVTLTTNNNVSWNADITYAGPNDLNLGTGDVIMNNNRSVNVTAGTLTMGGTVKSNSTTTDRNLTKNGDGTLVLGGTNTYGGTTAVTAGTLVIDGDTDSSATTISSGATLVVNGTLGGTTTINGGTLKGRGSLASVTINAGTLAPGNSIDTTTVGELSLSGNYEWEVDNSGSDLVVVDGTLGTGNLDISGDVIIDITPLEGTYFSASDVFTLFTYDGTLTTDGLTNDLTVTYGGIATKWTVKGATFADIGGTITLTGIEYIPEPSTLILAGLGLLGVTFRRRRRSA